MEDKHTPNCKCHECIITSSESEMSTHLTNLYAQMNLQNKTLHDQCNTLTLILNEVIPLLKSIDRETNKTNTALNTINSFLKINNKQN